MQSVEFIKPWKIYSPGDVAKEAKTEEKTAKAVK
jgi:hypothetical protein